MRPSSASPERRQLTVMFCDLAGSTALAEQLDPEEVRQPILRLQRLIAAEVMRYGGSIARTMGDGALAYFGYPLAHEDGASRAIHAGLSILQELQRLNPPLLAQRAPSATVPLRIGIATGLVVVGDRMGDGTAEEAAAFGEAPNLAARLQSAAEEGQIMVAASTRDLAGRRFAYAPPVQLVLKGFGDPVRAWPVLGVSRNRSRFDATRAEHLVPMVARSAELGALQALWQQAASGQGRIVLVAGDGGIGKSRLAHALADGLARQLHFRLRYQCSPYHTDSALHPFIRQLENAANLSLGASAGQKLDKLEALLTASSAALASATPLFAELLSLQTDGRYPTSESTPHQRRQRTFAAMLGRLHELAASRPLLLLLEDAHWSDPTTLELLELLAREVARMPVLLVVTSRVVAQHPWLKLPHGSVLRLKGLAPAPAAELVAHVAADVALPAELVQQVVERAGGNPLAIEELTKAAVAGQAAPWVPTTLQDSLLARLDRLGLAKDVAQVGSVIGREFSRALLMALLPLAPNEIDQALDRLCTSSVLQRTPQQFVFRHALLQDAAYASLLRSRRQELHRRIAEAIVTLEPERARSEPELMAHHHALAGQPLAAARYCGTAAMRALERSANVEALRQIRRGSECLSQAEASVERDRTELMLAVLGGAAHRAVSGFASSDAERCFVRALQLCEQLADVATAIDVRRGLFSLHYARGELARARARGEQVAAAGELRDERASRMLGHWMVGCVSSWQGDFVEARRDLEWALSLYVPQEHRARALAAQIDPAINARAHLAWVLWILGEPDKAVQAGEQAVADARALAQPLALSMALFFDCVTRACRGELGLAESLLDELFEVTREHRLTFLGSCAHVLKAQTLIARGDCVGGLVEVDVALREFEEQEAGLGRPWTLTIAAWGCARLGRRAQGLRFIEAAFEAIERQGEHHWEAEVWRLKGELLESDDEAQNCLRQAIAVARRQSARSLEQRALASLAQRGGHHG
jgi:class 3 adenylate cyclase/tetratricopeptide (TPR) repeat protein